MFKTIRTNACAYIQLRHIATTTIKNQLNHYTILGITPKATQSDVKTAYYRLSMQFHPDKNKGCTDAAAKFLNITEAYEVLSNYRLRRLYDRGLIQTKSGLNSTSSSNQTEAANYPVEDEDDPQTKFYKRHMTRTQAPHMSGRTPIYNFDEWTEAHYGKSFARKQQAQTKHRDRQMTNKAHTGGRQTEVIMIGLFGVFLGLGILCVEFSNNDYDRISKNKK